MISNPQPAQECDTATLTSSFGFAGDLLEEAAAAAFRLLKDECPRDAAVLARGLVAAKPRFWYYRTLLAMSLVKLGRVSDATATIDEGLLYHPGHPELVHLSMVLAAVTASQGPAASIATRGPSNPAEARPSLMRG